jgi:hypothetical protein
LVGTGGDRVDRELIRELIKEAGTRLLGRIGDGMGTARPIEKVVVYTINAT